MLSLVSSCVSHWFPGGSSAILVPLLDLHRHIYRCTLKFFDHTCDLLWRSTTFSQWFFPESIIYCSETTTWFSAAYLLTVTPFRGMTHHLTLKSRMTLIFSPPCSCYHDVSSCGFYIHLLREAFVGLPFHDYRVSPPLLTEINVSREWGHTSNKLVNNSHNAAPFWLTFSPQTKID